MYEQNNSIRDKEGLEYYAECYLGNDFMKSEILITKSSLDYNKSKVLAANILINIDGFYNKVVIVEIKNYKGSIYIDDIVYEKALNKEYSNSEILKGLKIFIRETNKEIKKSYNFNIINKNFFWNELKNLENKFETFYDRFTKKNSLDYTWNQLSYERQEYYIDKISKDLLYKGVVSKEKGLWFLSRPGMCNQLKESPKDILFHFIENGIINNENYNLSNELISSISNKVADKLIMYN